MHDERLIIVDQKLIELDSIFRMKSRDPVNFRSDLGNICFHIIPPVILIEMFHSAISANRLSDKYPADCNQAHLACASPLPACRCEIHAQSSVDTLRGEQY